VTPRRSPQHNRALRSDKSLSHRARVSALRTLAALFCAQDEGWCSDKPIGRWCQGGSWREDMSMASWRRCKQTSRRHMTQITAISAILQGEC